MCSTDEQRAVLVNGACNHRAPGLLRHWHGLTWSHKATAGQKAAVQVRKKNKQNTPTNIWFGSHSKLHSKQMLLAFWRKVLRSDKTKTELFDHLDKSYVWRRKDKAFKSKNTVKHGDGSIVLWAVCCQWMPCNNNKITKEFFTFP